MYRADQLDVDRACLLVIDLQEKLLPLIASHERIVQSSLKLIEGVCIFSLPVVVTEQYPKGIGSTDLSIRAALEKSQATILEKPTFSAWAHPPVVDVLLEIDRPQVIGYAGLQLGTDVGSRRELALGESIHAVVFDDVDQRHVTPQHMHELAETNRSGVAVAGGHDAHQVVVGQHGSGA